MNIGIIGAMKEEIKPLLDTYKIEETIIIGDNTFYKTKINENNIFIVQSKIGKVFAAMTTTLLTHHFKCDNILFTGVAGAIDPELDIGDLVLADKLVTHDFDVTEFGHPHGHVPEYGVYSQACDKLLLLAKETADELDIKTKIGTIATGDQFVNSNEQKTFIKDTFNAKALEMEGSAVAQICQTFGVPFFILRSISDKAEGGADIDFQKFVEESAIKSSKLIIEMLKKL